MKFFREMLLPKKHFHVFVCSTRDVFFSFIAYANKTLTEQNKVVLHVLN